MQRLISVDWRATFGFLKKPDINEGMYLTYNLLHKPALLGMLGAVAGLGGYGRPTYMLAERVLEHRRRLADVRVAIAPLDADRGNFRKAVIKYTNTVGYANDGSTLIVAEQTLLRPAYRTWLLLDDADEVQALLLSRLQRREAEYVPYLGKNEFPVWWENVREWEFTFSIPTHNFVVSSVFRKPSEARIRRDDAAVGASPLFGFDDIIGSFVYLERLPQGFQKMGKEEQYELAEFMLTDFSLSPSNQLSDLYKLRHAYEDVYIQLI